MRHYDLAVIGTGPAGQKAAIQAAKLGKRVAVIEKSNVVGGAQVNTGTLPSKAMREAAIHLTGAQKRHFFSGNHSRQHVTISELTSVSQRVSRNEREVIGDAFHRNRIDLIWGTAHFEGPNLLQFFIH